MATQKIFPKSENLGKVTDTLAKQKCMAKLQKKLVTTNHSMLWPTRLFEEKPDHISPQKNLGIQANQAKLGAY